MESIPTWTPVVALALCDGAGRVLLQQRPMEKHHGGLWEFPGGKVEIGENPRLALVREIAEELAIAVETSDCEPALLADEGAAGGVVLLLYRCTCWTGDICPSEGQAWGWYTMAQAAMLPLAPMDRDLLGRLPV